MNKVVMQDDESVLAEKYTEMGESLQTAFEMYLSEIHAMIAAKGIEGQTADCIEAIADNMGQELGREFEERLISIAEGSKQFVQDIIEADTYTE